MDYSKFVNALMKPGEQIIAEMTPNKAEALHMAIGISGEVAELTEAFLRSEIMNDWIMEELGDTFFFIEGLHQVLGIGHRETHNVTVVNPKTVIVVAGELLDAIKKYAIYNQEVPRAHVVSKLGELMMLLRQSYERMGITESDIISANMKKLSKRYEKMKFSNEAAKERADKN